MKVKYDNQQKEWAECLINKEKIIQKVGLKYTRLLET